MRRPGQFAILRSVETLRAGLAVTLLGKGELVNFYGRRSALDFWHERRDAVGNHARRRLKSLQRVALYGGELFFERAVIYGDRVRRAVKSYLLVAAPSERRVDAAPIEQFAVEGL